MIQQFQFQRTEKSRDLKRYLYKIYVAALCTVAKGGNNPDAYQRMNEQNAVLYIHVMEYYSAFKRTEILPWLMWLSWLEHRPTN